MHRFYQIGQSFVMVDDSASLKWFSTEISHTDFAGGYDIVLLFTEMEDGNDLEQVTRSPSYRENEFVHVELVDSAQMHVNMIDQVKDKLDKLMVADIESGKSIES
ncbi:hypothetical protein HanRHA438_Chr02g0050401 [Helianthus annuus]|uniref:Uncharacterized protein n=1 Tax=Helianthus annuus TaxID=4232 RepID=A0A251VDP8_HELAN|nr:uncharacterized protein LOC110910555 [Helianthus annuus]KAF5817120.1 hypothetical protein HanXRQr2_Chr02g0049301 [Helianthus annuus]KAJ0534064.1 hypothetical protein HanIR_Chr09g0415571 [Helianthus annuus]KAJ0938490.1 hypothetical protein HanRHA438_Chr02g0050401 [Helianthus annuus]